MKRTFLTAIFTLLITLPCLAGQYPVLKVVDGDTIDIKYRGNSEKHHSEFLAAEKKAQAQGLNIWTGNVIDIGNEDLTCKLVRGDVKSMVFHQPGCRYFDCKNCTKAFLDRHEALKAGYKPCGICKS